MHERDLALLLLSVLLFDSIPVTPLSLRDGCILRWLLSFSLSGVSIRCVLALSGKREQTRGNHEWTSFSLVPYL